MSKPKVEGYVPEEGIPEKKDPNSTEDYNILIQERAKLIESGNKSIEQFDKGILTISTGVLALSITFIKELVPTPNPDTTVFLITSWLFWGASLLITLTSFLTSHKAFSIATKNLFKKDSINDNKFRGITIGLNISSIVTITLGFLFWAVFIYKNLV